MTHDDDEMDALLRDAARGYNEPPATPRDEMWTRIARARGENSVAPVGILPLAWRRNAGRIAAAAAGIAAVLLIGVLIGRTSITGVRTPQVASTARTPADTPMQVAVATPTESTTARPTTPERGTATPQQTSSGSRQKHTARSGTTAPPRIAPEQPLDPQTAQRLYQLVALQHFGRTEQMRTGTGRTGSFLDTWRAFWRPGVSPICLRARRSIQKQDGLGQNRLVFHGKTPWHISRLSLKHEKIV